MSHSRLGEYARCGEQYRLKRIVKVPQRPSIAQVGGKAFHAWAEEYERARLEDAVLGVEFDHFFENELTTAEFESELHRTDFKVTGRRTRALPDGETIQVWRDQLGPSLTDQYERADWGDFDTIAQDLPPDVEGNTLGLEYHLQLAIPAWQGYVDQIRVDQHGNLMVVDLKTWSRKRTTSQLEEYAAACQCAGINARYAAYYSARKGLVEGKHLARWDSMVFHRYVELGRQGIDERRFAPSVGDHCSWCDVSEHCSFRPYL